MKHLRPSMNRLPWLLCLSAVVGCGDDTEVGEGTVRVTAYGEAFIEEGIPADEVGDGYRIEFDRFDVEIRDVRVAGLDVAVEQTVDVSAASGGAGHLIGMADVPSGDHGDASFVVGDVSLAGSATKGGETVSFAWDFTVKTHYDACETTTSVEDGGETTFQITIHADHLFYDSLVAEEPAVRFGAIAAADADGDGEVTEAELAATDIGSYDPGSDGGDDLWSYLQAQVRTLGHVDGEGHCNAHAE